MACSIQLGGIETVWAQNIAHKKSIKFTLTPPIYNFSTINNQQKHVNVINFIHGIFLGQTVLITPVYILQRSQTKSTIIFLNDTKLSRNPHLIYCSNYLILDGVNLCH